MINVTRNCQYSKAVTSYDLETDISVNDSVSDLAR